MARFFKGVRLGSFLHGIDLRVTGITPANPGGTYSVDMILDHILLGPNSSLCVSLTKSYGVAETYALDAGTAFPSATNPAYVYVIEMDRRNRDFHHHLLVDPIYEISRYNNDPLTSSTYHHDGDTTFLFGIVDPARMSAFSSQTAPQPKGSTYYSPRPANRTRQLEAYVRVLRDAELLYTGTVPASCVVARHDVY
jgi:hypothetical protein